MVFEEQYIINPGQQVYAYVLESNDNSLNLEINI